MMVLCRIAGGCFLCALLVCAASAQVIQFESGGLQFQTLTRDGITVMFAHMPARIRDYGMIQVAVSNGSPRPCAVGPQNFFFELGNGNRIYGAPAVKVINEFIQDANAGDVIKLVTTYEMGLYGMGRIRSTNGYEQRRQAALAVVSSKRLKAAAAASAIAFVDTELASGASTDGALFYPTGGRDLGVMTLKVQINGTLFEFDPSASVKEK